MAAFRALVAAALLSGVASMLSPRGGCAQRGRQAYEQWARSKDALGGQCSPAGSQAAAKYAKGQVVSGHSSTVACVSGSCSAGLDRKAAASFAQGNRAASRSTTVCMMPRDDRPVLHDISGGYWPGKSKGAPHGGWYIGGTWWEQARDPVISPTYSASGLYKLTALLYQAGTGLGGANGDWVTRTTSFKNGDVFSDVNGEFYREENLVLPSGRTLTRDRSPDGGEETDDEDASLPLAFDELKKLRGLTAAKDVAQELHTKAIAEARLPEKMRVVTSLNYALLGNPGTGKTTVARLLGRQLYELGLRESNVFVETTGEALVREGANAAITALEEAENGVLFIDEAEALEPSDNREGKAVLRLLAEAAENRRASLTIIIAGTKGGIEDKLYGFDPGLQSLFRNIILEDFTQPELKEIWLEMASAHGWLLKPAVADVASHRVARGRGVAGFANARTVRTLFERSYTRALGRIHNTNPGSKKTIRGSKARSSNASPSPDSPSPDSPSPDSPSPDSPHDSAPFHMLPETGFELRVFHQEKGRFYRLKQFLPVRVFDQNEFDADKLFHTVQQAITVQRIWPQLSGQFAKRALVMEVVDVIGPPPRNEAVPDLKEALAELDALAGLDEIKLQAGSLPLSPHNTIVATRHICACTFPYLPPYNSAHL